MASLEELADALAREALEAADRLGDDRLIDEISRAIGDSSPTSQEAFMTAVRIRMALGRGRKVLDTRLARRALPAPDRPDGRGETGQGDIGQGDIGQGDIGRGEIGRGETGDDRP